MGMVYQFPHSLIMMNVDDTHYLVCQDMLEVVLCPTHIARLRYFDRDAGVPGQEGITPILESQNFPIDICGHDVYP